MTLTMPIAELCTPFLYKALDSAKKKLNIIFYFLSFYIFLLFLTIYFKIMSVFNQLKSIFRNNNHDVSSEEEKANKHKAMSRIVKEDTIAKSRLPKYEGLEDYTLIKKLGE